MSDSDQSFDLTDDLDYVELLYRVILGRPGDAEGRDWYAGELRQGNLTRRDVLNQFLTSAEGRAKTSFKYDHEPLLELAQIMRRSESLGEGVDFGSLVCESPFEGAQLCECVNPDKWLDAEWRSVLEELGLSSSPEQMHRKAYEWAQCIYGLRQLDALREDSRCLGVGSGHEAILYWLANHAGKVVATDLYEGDWAREGALEGDPGVLLDAAKYAPFEYREDRLTFLQMDGRDLRFDDDSFDIVFSLGSIEHFGGNDAAARSMRDQARVCRPGGTVVVATELIVNGQPHEEFFFAEELRTHIVEASGMRLVQDPVLSAPAWALSNPCRMPEESHRVPHLVLDFDGVHTTSVILFLRHGPS